MKFRFGKEFWVFVNAYRPGSKRNEKDKENFWSILDDCLQSFGGNANAVVFVSRMSELGTTA